MQEECISWNFIFVNTPYLIFIPQLNSNIIHGNLPIKPNIWIEVLTFDYTSWNKSSVLFSFGTIIYKIDFGSTPEDYLSRCSAINIVTNSTDSNVGFKIINNVLHAYIKSYSSIGITGVFNIVKLAYYTENCKCSFYFKATELLDSDMDKIS